jgi:hypothetical protein
MAGHTNWRDIKHKAELSRLERVAIATAFGPVVVSWDERDQLLERLRRDRGHASSTVAAFEAVGASRPVALDSKGKAAVLTAIDAWVGDVGPGELPARVEKLLQALEQDRAELGW